MSAVKTAAVAKKTVAKKMGLREALAAKKSRVSHFDVPIVDSDVVDEISTRVRAIDERLDFATTLKNEEMAEAARKDLAKVKAELRACFYRISFTGLPLADFDALVNEYPPDAEQSKRGEVWGADFIYALIEASVIDGGGMTTEEWKAEMDSARWTRADRAAFFNAVLSANTQQFSEGIPKD